MLYKCAFGEPRAHLSNSSKNVGKGVLYQCLSEEFLKTQTVHTASA